MRLTRHVFFIVAAAVTGAATLGGCSAPPQAFDSPERAATALVDAVRADDEKAMKAILGGDAELLRSGDKVADRAAIESFLERYDRRHALERTEDTAVIVVGDDAWPMAIPIARGDDGAWRFDTEVGAEEVAARRVGANELNTIEACRALAVAQREYVLADHDGDGALEYAEKFASDPGARNGLYWETTANEPPSPLGALFAQASEEGYDLATEKTSDEDRAFHGYRYRILTEQGPDARGGAYPYIIGGRMVGGFAAIAWPVKYGQSGVMTFLVGVDGVVYERDLGSSTARAAWRMKSYNPGKGWTPVRDSAAGAE